MIRSVLLVAAAAPACAWSLGTVRTPTRSGRHSAAVRMANLEDSVVTLAPYFKVNDLPKFKEIWKADYANFQHKVAAPSLHALPPPRAHSHARAALTHRRTACTTRSASLMTGARTAARRTRMPPLASSTSPTSTHRSTLC